MPKKPDQWHLHEALDRAWSAIQILETLLPDNHPAVAANRAAHAKLVIARRALNRAYQLFTRGHG